MAKIDVRIDDVLCKAATPKAILVDIDGDDFWIPLSHVSDDSEVYRKDDTGTLVITDWIAAQKGIL